MKSGEEVIVTERGRPVARLTPLGEGGTPTGRVAQLVREGRIRPPTSPVARDIVLGPGAHDPEGRSLEILLAERSEGR
jgi:antitoxin (DNA-binding transcriptional repressor) of toxin-antitoxin stability system